MQHYPIYKKELVAFSLNVEKGCCYLEDMKFPKCLRANKSLNFKHKGPHFTLSGWLDLEDLPLTALNQVQTRKRAHHGRRSLLDLFKINH